jgi:hypothetical protein
MSRLKALKRLYKQAQSFEQKSDLEKIRQAEDTLEFNLNDFESQIVEELAKEGIEGSLDLDSDYLAGLLQPAMKEDDFYYPYDFAIKEKKSGREPSSQDYIRYLKSKNILP